MRVLVICRSERLALCVLRGLGRRRAWVHVLGPMPGRIARFSKHCRSYSGVEMRSLDEGSAEVLDRAVALCRDHDLEYVVPVDVWAARLALRLKPLLPRTRFFPIPADRWLRCFDDKWSFYEFLVEGGVPTPTTALLERVDRTAHLGVHYPVVVKPLSMGGGRGVVRVDSERELATLIARGSPAHGLPLVVQEFVPGRDVCLSFLADHGRLVCWAIQVPSADGRFEYVEDRRVVDIGRTIAERSSYDGVAHVDMRYDDVDGSVKILECNPRFWGSFELSTGIGVDFLGLGLEVANGLHPPAICASPVGSCPGLRWVLGNLLRRRISAGDISAPTRSYLRQRFGDPFPEVYLAAQRMADAATRVACRPAVRGYPPGPS